MDQHKRRMVLTWRKHGRLLMLPGSDVHSTVGGSQRRPRAGRVELSHRVVSPVRCGSSRLMGGHLPASSEVPVRSCQIAGGQRSRSVPCPAWHNSRVRNPPGSGKNCNPSCPVYPPCYRWARCRPEYNYCLISTIISLIIALGQRQSFTALFCHSTLYWLTPCWCGYTQSKNYIKANFARDKMRLRRLTDYVMWRVASSDGGKVLWYRRGLSVGANGGPGLYVIRT